MCTLIYVLIILIWIVYILRRITNFSDKCAGPTVVCPQLGYCTQLWKYYYFPRMMIELLNNTSYEPIIYDTKHPP